MRTLVSKRWKVDTWTCYDELTKTVVFGISVHANLLQELAGWTWYNMLELIIALWMNALVKQLQASVT